MSHILLTALAMLAFATNSILCRLALDDGAIDATSFTVIRLISGAVILGGIVLYRSRGIARVRANFISSLMLFIYAICFSFSYIELSAATGALILFSAVQMSMILYGLLKGERPGKLAWSGIVAAFCGLVYLLLPGVTAPPLKSSVLMIIAGVAWGMYSIRGKASNSPLTITAWNFIGTIPLVLAASLLFYSELSMSTEGVLLAIVSGGFASSMGYVIWYRALPLLTPTSAATVQLSVPVIAACGGIMLLSEPVSLRLLISGLVVLAGIYLTIKPAIKS